MTTQHNPAQVITRDIFTVTRLNREVRAVLEGSFPPLWVQGEISNLARPSSGHLYFSLKDKNSQVRCAMFKNRNRYLKFSPENGLEVVVRAGVSLYEGRGEFQLIVEDMEPAGMGALQKAFEELKARLSGEGLFDAGHKQPIPLYPQSIGIITSPTGAAIRDILHVLKRRYPSARVIVYPVAVQGEGAAKQIVQALETAQARGECDVLILARGGGSLEDLWSFNEEIVARAVYHCSLPVVCGVGHEIDFTIADFVADQRAPTPSAAAEIVSPNAMELLERLENMRSKLLTQTRHRIAKYAERLGYYEKRLPHPARRLQNISQHLDNLSLRLSQSIKTLIAVKRSGVLQLNARVNHYNPKQLLQLNRDKCRHLAGRLQTGFNHHLSNLREKMERSAHLLQAVSPQVTLERGYAIVTDPATGKIIRDAAAAAEGKNIHTRLARGEILSTVKKTITDS